MRVRDWLWVLLLWSLSFSAFTYLWEAIEHGVWWFAIACLGTGCWGCHEAISHWWYRSTK